MSPGRLFLVPVPLGSAGEGCLPLPVLDRVRAIEDFVVENAKTARSILKAFGHPTPIREIRMQELNEHTLPSEIPDLLKPALAGRDIGLMSEAGCPAVADPGSALVEHAHRSGIRVMPLVGPSSLLLALMASGMNGQRFSFHGYLPAREPDRLDTLRRLETDSRQHQCVEIFIETPYRNPAMLDACLRLSDSTRLCVACDLTQPGEWVRSASVRDWKRDRGEVDLAKRPAVFLVQAR